MVRRGVCPYCRAANVMDDLVSTAVSCRSCGRPWTIADRANEPAIPLHWAPVPVPIAMPAAGSVSAITAPSVRCPARPASVGRTARRAIVLALVSIALLIGMSLGRYAVRGIGKPQDHDSPTAASPSTRRSPQVSHIPNKPAIVSPEPLKPEPKGPVVASEPIERVEPSIGRGIVSGPQTAEHGTVICRALAQLTANRVTTLRAAIMESNAHGGGHNLIRFDIGGFSPVEEGVYTVNSTGDEPDSNPGDGVADVHGELKGSCGDSVHTIQLQSPLPALTQEVTIDGKSQPGYAATPVIELDGSDAPGYGLVIDGGDTIILALAIGNFSKSGILINSNDNRVSACFIGTNAAGTEAKGNGIGIEIDGGENVTIGGFEGDRNIISGNEGDGIYSYSDGGSGSYIGDYIGLDVTGTKGIGNGGNGYRSE